MERTKQIIEFWSWLPAFRVVAETEHLPTAAGILHVTPSAVSRTIRLLEAQLGYPLFDRARRRLQLNEAGSTFLKSVRTAMRMVHEGTLAVEQTQFVGAVHIAAAGPLAPVLVLPAMRLIRSTYPRLVAHIHAIPDASVPVALRQGRIDIALVDAPVSPSQLKMKPLLVLSHDLYSASSVPVRADLSRPIDLADLPPFAAPIASADGITHDAWPAERARVIGLRVSQMQVALEAVQSGDFVGVFPDLIARSQGLISHAVPGIRSSTLYGLHRPSLPIRGRTEVVYEALQTVAKSLVDSKLCDPRAGESDETV